MKELKSKGLLWGVTALAAVVIVLGVCLAWWTLVRLEANAYGRDFSRRLYDVVARIDQTTKQVVTPEFYQKIHRQPLSELHLAGWKEIQDLTSRLEPILKNPQWTYGLFTNCPKVNPDNCYDDFLFITDNPTHVQTYNPKSRPWYLSAAGHADWVIMDFIMFRKHPDKVSDVWALGFAKRLLSEQREREGEAPTALPLEGATRAPITDDGVWIVITAPSTQLQPERPAPQAPLLSILYPDQQTIPSFDNLEMHLKTIRIPQELLDTGQTPPISCGSFVDLFGVSYTASIQCILAGQAVQFVLSKRVDHLSHLFFLGLLGCGVLWGIHRMAAYVISLQQSRFETELELEKGRIAKETGARLVHDLKKGILSQLIRFHERTGTEQLTNHLETLSLLNKFIDLLGRNLKGQGEADRILLTPQSFQTQLELILGPVEIRKKESMGGKEFLRMTLADVAVTGSPNVLLQTASPFPKVRVPEISFYRVLKNIIENYYTYGSGELALWLTSQDGWIELNATNPVEESIVTKKESTRLGLSILRQVLKDNFGKISTVEQKREEGQFFLKIRFPQGGTL